jgi:tRNA G18 (ribose-2'-O)-methylase SpoU
VTPRVRRLSSETNAFQHVEVLKRNRTRRQQHHELFVEGVRPITELVASDLQVESLWWSVERPLSDWAKRMRDAAGASDHYVVTPELMAKLSDREEPSELVATARMPADDLDRIRSRDDLVIVMYDRPASPRNLGTLIRSAHALGADGVVVCGHSADVYDPQTIRASLGAQFALPIVRKGGTAEVFAWLDTLPVRPRVIGTDSEGPTAIAAAVLQPPIVIVAGNEAAGMSYRLRERCDDVVSIPMRHEGESLNVAVATSIVLYEIARRHAVAGHEWFRRHSSACA